MAEIPVQRKSGVPWWLWLVGLLLLIGAVWLLMRGGDSDTRTATPAALATVATPTPDAARSATSAPSEVAAPGAATATVTAASGTAVTDSATYASTSDKLSLVGREAVLSGVKVVRIVGPKTFTVASGSDELFVMVDEDLSRGVGSQGQIDKGETLNVKGTFQRLRQEEIDAVSNNRFRELAPLERETLHKTQVYLHATEFGKIS